MPAMRSVPAICVTAPVALAASMTTVPAPAPVTPLAAIPGKPGSAADQAAFPISAGSNGVLW